MVSGGYRYGQWMGRWCHRGRQAHKTCLLPCFSVALRTFPILCGQVGVTNLTGVPNGGLVQIVVMSGCN